MNADNLIARLRNADIGVCDEAADEIERLQTQVAELVANEGPCGEDGGCAVMPGCNCPFDPSVTDKEET